MKKHILLFSAILLTGSIAFGQTAVDFTVNDCSGSSHTLFSELNAGKVVVITWVMPCSACISVASTVKTTVAGFSSSYPGRVKFYLVDDDGGTSCSTLNSWANTNSITTDANFSNSAIKMTDYGTAGMQKTVVLGGINHSVCYNVVGAVSASALQTAINNCLALSTGIEEQDAFNMEASIFPVPANNAVTINYTLNKTTDVNIEVFNLLGIKVKSLKLDTQAAGIKETQINIESLTEGIYFISITAGDAKETVKISVTR